MRPFRKYLGVVLLLCSAVFPGVVHAQEVRLPITPHVQEHSLSCEIATLKVALGVHGIDVSEDELIGHLPFDVTPKQGGVWGDPHTAFVGNIDGRMLVDGYGVYWQPIANVGSRYTRTRVLTHGSAQQLAQEIAKGNPVIIWGHYGARRAVFSWQTPQGKQIQGIDGEHTRLVYGFDGSVKAPTRFYLLDPANGVLSWSTAELMHNWSSLNHMGVVVLPRPTWMRVAQDTKVWEIDAQNKTRRWVSTWQAFINRGGRASAVQAISPEKLLQYSAGAPIK